MKLLIGYSFSLFFFLNLATAQEEMTMSSEQEVIKTIKTLFDGMRAGDSTMLRSVLHPDAHLQSSFTDKTGIPVLKSGSIDGWVKSVGTPHEAIYDEKIWSYKVRVDDNLASVWTEYTFYVGDKMSHCGVNAFHVVNTSGGWKISHITDTRRKQDCITAPVNIQQELNDLMNKWHKAAATGDHSLFFGSMTSDGIYIGTDAKEKWDREEMKAWSKIYFDKGTAWDFETIERNIYVASDEDTAWFDETLDTWMGVCRGSGILERTKTGWKIKHYHLAVAVPNEEVEKYLKIATPSKKLKKS